MLVVTWKVERCSKCRHFAVKSQDEFLGCLKCRDLSQHKVSHSLERGCVFCGQPLILLMDACLTCGNQPRFEKDQADEDETHEGLGTRRLAEDLQ